MAIHPDPRDPNIIYLCQEDGNTARLDLRTWTRTELQPTDDDAARMGLAPLRWDWSQPMILSAADPDVVYLGSQYVFRCRMGKTLASGETGAHLRGGQRRPDGTAERTVSWRLRRAS